MRTPDVRLAAALAPVREAMLDRARADAAGALARADAEARDALSAAAAQAERIRQEARQAGIADAEAAIAAERGRARREGRALVLRARREAYERLRRTARDAVGGLLDDGGLPAVRQRMAAAARAALGPDARIDDTGDGGVVATAAGRRLDLSLTRFADRAVDRVAGEGEP
jgi:hypothetical protein